MSDENTQDIEPTEENTAPDTVGPTPPVEEAESVTEPTPEPIPEPVTPPPAPEPTPVAPIKQQATGNVSQAVVTGLEDYITAMDPKKSIAEDVAITHQVKLFRLIQSILRTQGRDFSKTWSYLLEQVHKNREGVFNERYAFRFFDKLRSLPLGERKNFERILSMILTTCDPALRNKTVKQVDITLVMKGFKNPEIEQKVIAFYTVIY